MSAQPKQYSSASTFLFMLFLCVICAFLLSSLAAILRPAQDEARKLDRNKQMLIAAKILSYNGHFQMKDKEGKYTPAKANAQGILSAGSVTDLATEDQIRAVYEHRIEPLVTNAQGDVKTFPEAGLDLESYLAKHAKLGYYLPKWKLFYKIKPNESNASADNKNPGAGAEGYIIPVNGFGLWSAIYGYLAIASDADTVIGTTWYQQEETAGLGAEIATQKWQSDFPGKKIFQESVNGTTNFQSAPLGIIVVKGDMSEQYAKTPKAKSSVDGISGATLTGNGVTAAYAASLEPYRAFLIKMHNANQKGK